MMVGKKIRKRKVERFSEEEKVEIWEEYKKHIKSISTQRQIIEKMKKRKYREKGKK
ncbi:hypothetical protein ACFLQQ_03700 [Actinomycetota bacterium]